MFLMCQCPLGLMPHFYYETGNFSRAYGELCQCPLGLMPHFYRMIDWVYTISIKCQCPLGLMPHFYLMGSLFITADLSCVNALSGLCLISTVPLQKPRFYAVSRACFCRYLSEYSDSNCFSCMLTIWTYLTRYTYL